MFNIDTAIHKWRKRLEQHPELEPGYIEELESHLRDKIDSLEEQGYHAKEAFEKAISVISDTNEIAEEYRFARSKGTIQPPWKNRYWVPA